MKDAIAKILPCGVAGRFWWPTSDPDSKDMYAMALTAFVTSKTVQVAYNQGAPSCQLNSAQMTHMLITN